MFACVCIYKVSVLLSGEEEMDDGDGWRTPAFRQSAVSRIEEAIRLSGVSTSRNSLEMENHVFQKAKTEEEYLGYVDKLILQVRESNSTTTVLTALENLTIADTHNPSMNIGGPQQRPISPPQQMASTNLLNRGPGQAINNMQGFCLRIMTDPDCWRIPAVRKSVASKIQEAVRESGLSILRSSQDLENDFFSNARSKEEYLDQVSRFIFHLCEMNPTNSVVMALEDLTIQDTRHPLMNIGGSEQGPGQVMNNIQVMDNQTAQMEGQTPNQVATQLSGQMSNEGINYAESSS